MHVKDNSKAFRSSLTAGIKKQFNSSRQSFAPSCLVETLYKIARTRDYPFHSPVNYQLDEFVRRAWRIHGNGGAAGG